MTRQISVVYEVESRMDIGTVQFKCLQTDRMLSR
jgi:hypothetical protein